MYDYRKIENELKNVIYRKAAFFIFKAMRLFKNSGFRNPV